MVTRTLAIAALLLSTACQSRGIDKGVSAVILGARDNADPAVVLITQPDGRFCSGTVIAPRFVLTAGHCVPWKGGSVSVTLGGSSTRSARIHLPPDVDGYENDIAVVELAEPTKIEPIPVNFDPDDVEGLSEGRLVGFGETGVNMNDGQIKRTAPIQLEEDWPYIYSVGEGEGSCFGDSGGPLLARVGGKEIVVGIVSRVALDCHDEGRIYVRTDLHREFLSAFVTDAPVVPPTPKPQLKPTTRPPIVDTFPDTSSDRYESHVSVRVSSGSATVVISD